MLECRIFFGNSAIKCNPTQYTNLHVISIRTFGGEFRSKSIVAIIQCDDTSSIRNFANYFMSIGRSRNLIHNVIAFHYLKYIYYVIANELILIVTLKIGFCCCR